MNLERRIDPATAQPHDDITLPSRPAGDTAADVEPRSRRRALIIGAIILAAALALAWYAFGRKDAGDAGSAAVAAGGADAKAKAVPTVTVIIPARQTVERRIAATGTLAARREMPVGVAGEGGQVTSVLVEPGQWVGAGQVLAVIDRQVQTQQLASIDAQIRVAEADAQLAQNELDRAAQLVSRGFVSKADLDRRTAARDAAVARVRVARAQRGEAVARTGRLDIRAPAAGLVLTRDVEPGQVVSGGSGVLFRIARGGEMELLAQVAETDLQTITTGTRAEVTPVGTDLVIGGQVWQVAPVVDPTTRQGTARISLPYSAALRPGGFASAQLVTGSAIAPLLPESAVQTANGASTVLIVDDQGTVQRVPVTVGSVTDAGVSILSGLSGTERVILLAGAFLNPGDKVKPVVERRAGVAAPAPASSPATAR